jgi:hypothetical protein
MPNHGSFSFAFIPLWPSTTIHDSTYAHSVSNFSRQSHSSQGNTCIPRHLSHPLRHIWAIITYIDILCTCHIEYSRVPSYFFTFGDVSCMIKGSNHMCVIYDSRGGVFRVDLTWRGTFLALWMILS